MSRALLEIGGKIAEESLELCGITVNKNMIPFDERKPVDPSGIRVGTPALTTRGMGPDEMRRIGNWMLEILKNPKDDATRDRIRGEIREFTAQFPAPAAMMEPV